MPSLAQRLLQYSRMWRMTHEALHGPLDAQTAETVSEALSFVISCSQGMTLDDGLTESGVPYSQDLQGA